MVSALQPDSEPLVIDDVAVRDEMQPLVQAFSLALCGFVLEIVALAGIFPRRSAQDVGFDFGSLFFWSIYEHGVPLVTISGR